MTYRAKILGEEVEIVGWDEEDKLVLADGTKYVFKSLAHSRPDHTSRRIAEVVSLQFQKGEWVLNGETDELGAPMGLDRWLRMEELRVLERRGIPQGYRTSQARLRALRRANAKQVHLSFFRNWFLSGLLKELQPEDSSRVVGVAWFRDDENEDRPLLLQEFHEILSARQNVTAGRLKDVGEQTSQPGRGNVFRKRGDFWEVGYKEGPLTTIKHQVGMSYLQKLLSAPRKEHPAQKLSESVHGSSPDAKLPSDVPELFGGSETPRKYVETLDVDTLVDPDTRRRIQERIKELNEESETATQERREEIEEEIHKASAYLSKTTFSGESRRFSAAPDRVRKAIKKAIARAIAALEKQLPALALHLKQFVKMSGSFTYVGDQTWQT